jgi:hypothetical protein
MTDQDTRRRKLENRFKKEALAEKAKTYVLNLYPNAVCGIHYLQQYVITKDSNVDLSAFVINGELATTNSPWTSWIKAAKKLGFKLDEKEGV